MYIWHPFPTPFTLIASIFSITYGNPPKLSICGHEYIIGSFPDLLTFFLDIRIDRFSNFIYQSCQCINSRKPLEILTPRNGLLYSLEIGCPRPSSAHSVISVPSKEMNIDEISFRRLLTYKKNPKSVPGPLWQGHLYKKGMEHVCIARWSWTR